MTHLEVPTITRERADDGYDRGYWNIIFLSAASYDNGRRWRSLYKQSTASPLCALFQGLGT